MDRLHLNSSETDAKVEAGLTDKSYDELVAELATNRRALQHTTTQAQMAQNQLDTMTAQKSILEARRQALIDELNGRE